MRQKKLMRMGLGGVRLMGFVLMKRVEWRLFGKTKKVIGLYRVGRREGDETPRETFVREVLEEVQAEPVDIIFFCSAYARCFDESGVEYPPPQNARHFRYICKLKNIQDFVPRKNGSEIDERKFVALEDLPNYVTWLKDSESGRESFERLKSLVG